MTEHRTATRDAWLTERLALLERHTSAYARGSDALWNLYQFLDRAPLGRNETGGPEWIRRRDEYPVAA